MAKFKVGDVVKRSGGFAPHQRMRITKVVNDDDYSVEWLNGLDGSIDHWRARELELANDSPIRTVTRREIVPGVYGEVTVERIPFSGFEISYSSYGNAHKLRAAARIFNEIADVLDEKSAEAQKEAA